MGSGAVGLWEWLFLMILDRMAFYRYISETSGMFFMVAQYLKGGVCPIFDLLKRRNRLKILNNQSNYLFGGELC